MLKMYSKSVNISAASMFDIKGNVGTPAAVFSASFGSDGKTNFAESVQNADVYNEHFDEIIQDSAEFKRMVKEEYNEMYGSAETGNAGD